MTRAVHTRWLRKALAALLDYPDARWRRRAHRLLPVLAGRDADAARALEALLPLAAVELESLYVATFDLDRKTSLQLSAHLPPDLPPGPVLALALDAIRTAGYAVKNPAWVDHLPTLLEFLAVSPDPPSVLSRLVGQALAHLVDCLDPGHPYRPLVGCAAGTFGSVSQPGGALSEFQDPSATVPYPLLF
ncbi:MAG: hypothetical protein K6U14_03780 [Firmicutes bacterium]|nr:hypothetical protein [Alicyclobacillaceae bacterium]MCL6496741.1 hypothetical protein [Bacillota bacterium]